MSGTPLEDPDNEAIVNEMLAQQLINITNIDPGTSVTVLTRTMLTLDTTSMHDDERVFPAVLYHML